MRRRYVTIMLILFVLLSTVLVFTFSASPDSSEGRKMGEYISRIRAKG